MKKIFIVGFFLTSTAYTTFGSEPEIKDNRDDFTRFSKLRVEYNAETGKTIFYPEKYKTYQDYKENYLEKQHVTELLTKRLTLLANFRKQVLAEPEKINYQYHRVLFGNNEMQLIGNAPKGTLDGIEFNINYSSYEELTNHSIKIAELLKERLEQSLRAEPQQRKQEKVSSLIDKITGFIEQNTKGQVAGDQRVDQGNSKSIMQDQNGLQKMNSGDLIHTITAGYEPISASKSNIQQCPGEHKTSISPLPSKVKRIVQ